MNSNTLSGTLMTEFKVSTVGDKKVAKTTLIVRKPLSKDKKEELEGKGIPTADFPKIEVWGSPAKIDYLTENVTKGDKLLVEGSIQTGNYTNKEGKKVYTTVINVNDFEFEYKPKENFDEVDI